MKLLLLSIEAFAITEDKDKYRKIVTSNITIMMKAKNEFYVIIIILSLYISLT